MINLLKENHITNTHVFIEGKKIEFVSLELEQAFGEHHKFHITLDYDIFTKSFTGNPSKQIKLIGKFLDIDLLQGIDSSNAYEFRGIICEVSHEASEGKHGFLVIEGMSTTVLLEKGKRLDIFSNMSLGQIFDEVTKGIVNKKLSCVNQPSYTEQLNFVMQYYESDWEFLKRLSCLTSETLFYTGRDLVFGQYEEWKETEVTYDEEITYLKFGSRLVPNHFSHYQYLPEKDETIEQEASSAIEGSNDYVNATSEGAQDLTELRPVNTPASISVTDMGALGEVVSKEKSANATQTVFIKGTTKTCAARIGRLINIHMPKNMPEANNLGSYRVIKVKHIIDQNHRYRGEFEAIPSGLKYIPVTNTPRVVAESVLATVIKNDDPEGQGRVRVEFPFAKDRVCNSWLRVMTPDAGSSSEITKNRGFVFVPEKDDQVMVGFEFGDPNRPYVMGSIFHGKNSKGGQENNHIKSIITRNGHIIEFDDADSSLGITIKDKNGNIVHLDTKGKNIEVKAPETIKLSARNISINASENIGIHAAGDVKVDAENIKENAVENILQLSRNMSATVDEKYSLSADAIKEIAGTVDIYSQKENMTLYSKKNVETKSGSKKIRLS